ncbi:MAG: hypothetical protein CMJ59_08675 [Planctomycetaceae bacterium]|nr:hypothetical protein [Planctomycetaceae bacterium]
MRVHVELPSSLIHESGAARELLVTAASPLDAIQQLGRRFPRLQKRLFDADGQLFPYLTLLHNGHPLLPAQMRSVGCQDGDTLEVMTLAGGG